MRTISGLQIILFLSMAAVAVMLGIVAAVCLLDLFPLGDFRGVTIVFGAIILVYVFAILEFRLFLRIAPLPPGEIAAGSREEFIYHVYLLFFLIFFYPLMLNDTVPVPLKRVIYLGLGAKLGPNTYGAGVILDPPFVRIGGNTIIGLQATIVPHVIEGSKLAHHPVVIGNNVTIGAHAIVMAGVTIEDVHRWP